MRRRPLAGALLLAATLPAVVVAGCSHDGRTLRPPPPGATAPTTAPTTVTSSGVAANPPVGSNGDAESNLRLTSTAFAAGDVIPARYSCRGDNVSPPLAWTGIPEGTVELAITVVDPDASGGFIHWVIAGLDPSTTGLEEDASPEGAVEARNDTSEFGWFGPCPPAGATHHYVFTLYALTAPLGLPVGVGGPEALARIQATPNRTASLTGLFTTPA